MPWTFTAATREDLAKVRLSLPQRDTATVAGELFQITWLLESLSQTHVLEYPFTVRHTGESSVPDFQMESGPLRIAVETAKVTTSNLEHARSLQQKMPEPPLHYSVADLCQPEVFAWKLKADRNGWYKFIDGRLSPECRNWLSSWNGHDKVPDSVKSLFVTTLNSIIDGPPIASDPALVRAVPRPEIVSFEGFDSEETARHRKAWLDDALWEEWATPVNRTLMVSPFIRQDDSKMSRKEVLETGFLLPAMPDPGPTLQEEHQIWLDHVFAEIEDKTKKLAGPDFCHGDDDWLVLWDLLGTADWQLGGRARAVENRLMPLWRSGWFSRVFLQDQYFEWQLMFAPSTTVILRPKSNQPQ